MYAASTLFPTTWASALRKLLRSSVIGVVTTHDLTLAETEDLNARAVPVHLTESVGDGDEGLIFDYRLRTGIATSTNALRLLKLVGLGGEGGPSIGGPLPRGRDRTSNP